jgi:hypothetical protein
LASAWKTHSSISGLELQVNKRRIQIETELLETLEG